MVVLTSHAETTTDNLLNNDSFTTNTSGWELSDNNQNKVKRDPNTYSDSASKSIRFRYQDGSISQDIDMDKLPDNHTVKQIHMNFQSIGCGNTGNQWCTAGADDTVTNTVTLTSTDTAEVISNTTAVPYEDGWNDYSFTEDVTGNFNTDNLNINLKVTGNDTGNSSSWYGPIVDNLNFTLTIEEYIAPVVVEPNVVQPIIEPIIEPIIDPIIEPIIEPIIQPIVEPIIEPVIEEPVVAVIEETKMIEGLDLDTEIVTDVIIDTPVQIDVANVQLPELPPVEINIPEAIDMPQEIGVVKEIQEINAEPIEDLIEEVVEQPEELKETTMEEDLAEAKEKIDEVETEESDSKEKENSSTEEATTEKDQEKNKPKAVAKVNKPVVKANKPSDNADTLGEVTLPLTYLQVIQDTIKITETVSLTQEMIYEQDIGSLASSATYDNLISSSSSRWVRMVDVRPKHSFSGYGR